MPSQSSYKYRPRVSSFMSRNQAARVLQAAYRRRYTAESKDRSDLSRVVRSYRRANPYQIQPSNGKTVTFWRKTELSLNLNQLNGFGLGGNSIGFGFCLQYVLGALNGIQTYGPQIPNASEFQALFDYYRISAVKMQIFFSKTVSELSTTVTSGMPMLLIANDFDDYQEIMTLNLMNQRVGVRHVQFQSDNMNGINHYIKPKPTSIIVQTDPVTGVQTPSNSGVVFGDQWLDTAQSNIVHNGVKVFYNNQGLTTNVNLGSITFVFDVCIECKGYR